MTKTNYRVLGDEELASLFCTADTTVQTAVLRECARRDRRAAQSVADKAWWERVRSEWFDFAHAQYVAAETATNGYLLNRQGIAAGVSPWSLWSGPANRAAKYASLELVHFWEDNPRVTLSEFAYRAARPGRYAPTA